MPKVLVVDDEPDMRWLLTSVLRDQDFEVATAEDGQAALEQISREPPDVVLLDLKMPGLDGLQVLERANAADPHMPVVIVTAYGDLPSAVQAMRLGAYDYLTKPFDHDEILFTVRRALEKRELEATRLTAAKVATLLEAARALSHEINNPLAAILGHAQMLEKELREPKAAERVKVIIRRGERIARVLQRLSSIVEPVATFQPGVGPMLDLVRSRTDRGESTENGEDTGRR
ncbi:MAG: sigma-54-dependent Fis family transcriptional regulator [Candidatus Rokubacteria bacterium]|nr:sigma-54-dependent Fis family transcriptional regulator [Candidatus Rokubacteria bacterium]